MSLKLINGLFFSEHKLEGIDNKGLIEEITRTYTKGDNMIEGDRPDHYQSIILIKLNLKFYLLLMLILE